MSSSTAISDYDPTFSFISSLSHRHCAVDLEFKDIAYSVKVNGKPKVILDGLSGRFEHGKLNCVMGPSGAGKSSLLNVLTGFNNITKGEVRVNNVTYPAAKCLSVMGSISAFVMQDDHLLSELTCRETAVYAARFRLSKEQLSSIGVTTFETIADLVLKLFGLSETADVRVRNLSGGQRKRLQVAVEFFNYQPVIFLDECTTGLDSTSCYRLIRLLKVLAKCGSNIIATIHQPNSLVFRMFDWLYVIAPGGRLAYEGHPMAVPLALNTMGMPFNIKVNPADALFENDNLSTLCQEWHLLRLRKDFSKPSATKDIITEAFLGDKMPFRIVERHDDVCLIDINSKSKKGHSQQPTPNRQKLLYYEGKELQNFCNSEQRVSVASQLVTLTARSIKQAARDKVLRFGCLTFVGAAMLFGNLFFNMANDDKKLAANAMVIYCYTIAMAIGPCVLAVMNVDANFRTATREIINGWYSVSAFNLARAVVDAMVMTATAGLFTLTCWSMSQVQLLQYSLVTAICILCAQATAIHHLSFLLCLYGKPEGNTNLPFLMLIVHMLFGASIIPMSQLPSWIIWLSYINFSRYSYYGLMKARYSPIDGIFIEQCKSGYPLCRKFPTGTAMLIENQIDVGSPWIEWSKIMGCYAILFFIGLPLISLRVRIAKREIARI